IVYPLVGRISLGGKTIDQATAIMRQHLERYVRQPVVTLAITTLGQPNVLVLGDVKTPGKFQLRSDARITDAIAAAGGIADINGELPDARISDPSGNVSTVSLQKLLHDGDVSLDRPIAEGDVVYVPGPVTFDIVVTGAVDHPGDVQLDEGDRLSMAIAKAGNSAGAGSDLNNVKVMRTLPSGQRTSQTINLYQALEKNDSSADIQLMKGDVVYVPESKKRSDLLASPLLYLLGRLIIP
ncbi:MAG: SLBB domain-containing protein, partial [Candidatus Eremiobacteraeota bacterium]|nr:SLBB domain-containing protein [Candidatus Eremiobacteraeota bacterium]